ncbi:MAG TPA: glycerophosphodiester phosphodiesterase family protein [Polyangiaceae bacterium]|nr:glycerophosphodiester phosphodiesterase family protein [Polyangiaceae bacterium]
MSSPFTIVAKAGGSGEGAENTCAAIAAALTVRPPKGARLAVEVDVRLSADGALVALHDATLERSTDGSGRVRQHSLRRLRELRVGGAERIPLLEEVSEQVGEHELVVEAHDADVPAARALVRCLGRLGARERQRMIVASEHSAVVRAVRSLDPSLRTAASAREAWQKLICARLGLARCAPRGYVWMVPARHRGLEVVTAGFAESVRRAGDPLWVYVVDDASEALRLRALGASGCFTTRPRALCAELARRR